MFCLLRSSGGKIPKCSKGKLSSVVMSQSKFLPTQLPKFGIESMLAKAVEEPDEVGQLAEDESSGATCQWLVVRRQLTASICFRSNLQLQNLETYHGYLPKEHMDPLETLL